jgi:hypothetical protein
VVLGETAPMYAKRETQAAFLRGSRPYLDGYLSFFDGRAPAEVGDTLYDLWYGAALEQFLGLRRALVGAGS